MDLDETDVKLIDFLTKDSSISYTELAKQLDISDVAIKKRIDKLLSNKVIERFSLEVNYKEMGRPVHAFMLLKCIPSESDRLKQNISVNSEILRIMPTIGEYDYMIEVVTKDVESLRKIAEEQVGSIRGVIQVRTVLVV